MKFDESDIGILVVRGEDGYIEPFKEDDPSQGPACGILVDVNDDFIFVRVKEKDDFWYKILNFVNPDIYDEDEGDFSI